jgi:hypothetical protein
MDLPRDLIDLFSAFGAAGVRYLLPDRSVRSHCGFDSERQMTLDVIAHEALTFLGYGAAHVRRNGPVAAEDLCAAVVDVERVDAERGHGEERRFAAARWSRDDEHARSRHFESAGLERGVRIGPHVGRKLGRHQVASGIDDAELFEPSTRASDARRRKSRHAAFPFFAVLGLVQVEIVEGSARDERQVRSGGSH